MEKDNTWKARFEEEMTAAANARQVGNEGMARVCARRAVGIVIAAYLDWNGLPDPNPNAYDRLKYLMVMHSVPEEVKEVAAHFLVRITPEKKLPIEADLIADARWLFDRLNPEPPGDSMEFH